MRVIAGLGNPGKSYAGHRHNIGFMAVDAIAEAYRFSPFTPRFGGQIADGEIAGQRALLFKPQSFMNDSGQPVGELMRFYKLAPEALIVFHDELDLPLGKLRVKRAGGNGGHNGLKSIDAHLGQDYWRVRLGIGHPGDKDMVSDYVLSNFGKDEKKQVSEWLQAACGPIELLLSGDEAGYMNRVTLAAHKE